MNELFTETVPDSRTSLQQEYEALLRAEPKPVECTVPSNADEQRRMFLAGEVRNPDHLYPKLKRDYEAERANIDSRLASITSQPDFDMDQKAVYEGVVGAFRNRLRVMELARAYKMTNDDEERAELERQYLEVNIDLYGAPDKNVYYSLLSGRMSAINNKQLSGRAAQLRDELIEIVGSLPEVATDTFTRPSDETLQWAHDVVGLLYGGMLAHIPEQTEFTKPELKTLFEKIIDVEFGEAADGWRVVIEPASSINVVAGEKKIILPDNDVQLSRSKVRSLVVHELGAHMLRAISGEATDLLPLRTGIANYYDSEEGLGVVLEQALENKWAERGVPYYIIAGAAYHEGMDFRDLYEMQWRLSALYTLKGEDISQEDIEKKQRLAYGSVMRIMRGTDELPWFKDLAYFNGSNDIWRYLEEHRGDDFMLALLLTTGKLNPSDLEHRRVALETASV